MYIKKGIPDYLVFLKKCFTEKRIVKTNNLPANGPDDSKVEKILKGRVISIPSPSVKIQIKTNCWS